MSQTLECAFKQMGKNFSQNAGQLFRFNKSFSRSMKIYWLHLYICFINKHRRFHHGEHLPMNDNRWFGLRLIFGSHPMHTIWNNSFELSQKPNLAFSQEKLVSWFQNFGIKIYQKKKNNGLGRSNIMFSFFTHKLNSLQWIL